MGIGLFRRRRVQPLEVEPEIKIEVPKEPKPKKPATKKAGEK
jgi:hypothetical protein